jgi:MoaA/NifB/PqqE/SkfB family radical SAM enzyme
MKQELRPDAWLLYSPNIYCNLKCKYCLSPHEIEKLIPAKIKTEELIHVLENSGKKFLITLAGGGEPFLIPNIVDFSQEITKKHFLAIKTNLTIPEVKLFANGVDPQRVSYIYAFVHFEELFKGKLIDRFIENYLLLKNKGFNIIPIALAYPAFVENAQVYTSYFKNYGIDIAFDPFFGMYDNKFYPDCYTEEEKKIFHLSQDKIDKFKSKDKICNAGYNAGVIKNNGTIATCHKISLSLGHIYKQIHFNNFLIKCPYNECSCPLHANSELHMKAMEDHPAVGVFE